MDPAGFLHAPYLVALGFAGCLREYPLIDRRKFLAGTDALLLAAPLAALAREERP